MTFCITRRSKRPILEERKSSFSTDKVSIRNTSEKSMGFGILPEPLCFFACISDMFI